MALGTLHTLDARMQRLEALGPLAPKTQQVLGRGSASPYYLCVQCHRRQPPDSRGNTSGVARIDGGGKPLRDHLEALDHAEAWDALVSCSQNSEPLTDGNGRTGRLLLNLWLLRHHYVPMISEPEDRATYYTALQAADAGNFQPIVRAVIRGISHTLGIYEPVLRPPQPPTSPRPPRV